MKIEGIDKIYIVCCGKFQDRYEYMLRAMNELGFDKNYYLYTYFWISSQFHLKSELTEFDPFCLYSRCYKK